MIEAKAVAAKAAEVGLAIEAVDALGKAFRIDRLEVLEETLGEISRPRTLTGSLAFYQAWKDLVESSIDSERYDDAARLAKAASKAVRKTRDKVLARQAKELEEFAVALAKEFKKVTPFITRLVDDSNDAEAHREVAVFLCLHKRDWEQGLPEAAKDPSTPLGEVAEKDLESPSTSLEIVDVGTAWHELGKAYKDVPRVSCYIRAVKWLEAGLTGLPTLAREGVTKRLAKIYKEEPSLRPVVGLDRFKVLTLKSAWSRRYTTRSLDSLTISRSGDAISFKNRTKSSGSALVAETTKLNGDFEAAFELYGGKGIGLIHSEGHRVRRVYPTGKGWQRVRLARVDGKVECQINGREVKKQKPESRFLPDAEDKMSSNLFIALASSQECRIRNFTLRADLEAEEQEVDLDSILDRLRRGRGDDDDDDDDDDDTGRGRTGRNGSGRRR